MKRIGLILSIILSICHILSAQEKKADAFTMSGVVYDEDNNPLTGVTIYLRDKITVGTSTDEKGRFSLRASHGDMMVFTFVGYESVEHLVTKEEQNLVITFVEKADEIEEVVVVGLFGKQRKISNVAAITSVDVKDLQTPAPSIANLLGGRAAGVISLQSSGEPGKNISEFWVRGIGTFGANSSALVLIDGLEGNLNSIDPADVESFSILKDASATAVYGVRGANGVVLITTKRGQAGKLTITARANLTASSLNRIPNYLRAYDYAKLANEARVVRGDATIYNDVELDIIQDGLDRDMYPDVSWQDQILRKNSFRQGYYLSARGGAQVARYFISLGLSSDPAAYNYDKSNVYAANTGYKTHSFRTNIDLELSPTTKLFFGTDGFLSIHNNPGVANTDYIWYAQSNLNPLILPIKYSNGQLPATSGVASLRSPEVMVNNMGRRTDQEFRGKFTMQLDQDLSVFIQGLKVRAQGAYDLISNFSESRLIQPALFQAVGRDQQGELITIERVQAGTVSYGRGTDQYRRYHFESTLNYEQIFGDHRASALVYYYISDQKKASEGYNNLSAIPVRYQGMSSRITYGFRDIYMIDFNFGYTGSENFQPGRQYGFFPAVAGGWVPSNYEYVKNNMPWINLFKIRGSYGTVGNDRIGNRRFPYLTLVNLHYAGPWGSSTAVENVRESVVGADNLVWEKAIKSNLGFEGTLFDHKIQFVFDLFNDQRNGIFMQRVQVPAYAGLVNMPFGNVGKMRSYGADGSASFTQQLRNKDMSFTLRGNFTYSKNDIQNWEEANPKYPYQEVSGYPYGTIRGYQSLGFFKDWDDVENSPAQFGTVMPGDIKYRDVNGDGVINSDDRVPLSYSTYPLVMFGFGGEFRYKNFTLGVLFKGTGKTDFYHVGYGGNGIGYVPFYQGINGNVLSQVSDPSNRWIPRDYAIANGIDPALAENPNARYPRLSYGYNENNSQLSDFWKGDARYIRLQEVTINYNLRKAFLQRMKISSIDVQLIGNNLAIWDKVKLFDPEQAHRNGEVYPIPSSFIMQLYINL